MHHHPTISMYAARKGALLFCSLLLLGKACRRVNGSSSSVSYVSSSSSSYSSNGGGVSNSNYYYSSSNSGGSGSTYYSASPSSSNSFITSVPPTETPSSSPTTAPTPSKNLEAFSTVATDSPTLLSSGSITKSPTRKPTIGTKAPTTVKPHTGTPTISPTKGPSTDVPTVGPTIKPSPTTAIVAISPAETTNSSAQTCMLSSENRQRTILKILSSVSPRIGDWEQTSTASVESSSNPQNLAVQWILHYDTLQLCPTNKHSADEVIQRYIIALLYYSMDGSGWIHCRALNDTNIDPQTFIQDKCGMNGSTFQRFLSSTDECNWYGMKCNSSGHITKINLANNNLSGELPPELTYLSNLTQIDLSSNQIRGSIPDSLASFLPKLQVLDLQSNKLTGSLPENFGGLTLLEKLNLADNQITGSMPDSICTLRSDKLQMLSADCNPIIDAFFGTVNDGLMQCACCTQCSPHPATAASMDISQLSNVTCPGETTVTTEDDSKAPSIYILYVAYKIESVEYLGTHVDIALENALAQYVATSVLSCYWANYTKDQPIQISAYPPDSIKDTCPTDNKTENCVLINGFMSIQSSPGESLNLLQVKNSVENVLSSDAINLPITLTSSGKNITVKLSYFKSEQRSPSTGGKALTRSAGSSKTFAKNIFLSMIAGGAIMALLALLATSVHRRSRSNKRSPIEDELGPADAYEDRNNKQHFSNAVSPEIQFIDGDVLSVSDLGFSQRSLAESSVAWAFPNDDPFCKKATFVELEPVDFHPKVVPTSLDVANPFSDDTWIPGDTFYPQDSIDFNVVHQCPAWCHADTANNVDLRSLNESQTGDSIRSVSDFNSTVII